MRKRDWLIIAGCAYFGTVLCIEILQHRSTKDWFTPVMFAAYTLGSLLLLIELKFGGIQSKKNTPEIEGTQEGLYGKKEDPTEPTSRIRRAVRSVWQVFKNELAKLCLIMIALDLSLGISIGNVEEIRNQSQRNKIRDVMQAEQGAGRISNLGAIYKHHARDDYEMFHRCVAYFDSGYLSGGTWHFHPEKDAVQEFVREDKDTNVLIEGNCLSSLKIGDGLIIINGDLRGSIEVAGQTEILIKGNITSEAAIITDGIVSIFIGGNMDGSVDNKGSSRIIIRKDLNGSIVAGSPTMLLVIEENLTGEVRCNEDTGGMLSLVVEGFVTHETTRTIRSQRFTSIKAFVNFSDCNFEKDDRADNYSRLHSWRIEHHTAGGLE